MTYADTLPYHATKGLEGRIAEEVGIPKETVRFALRGEIQSWRTICKLAGWAKLYLDEYRTE